MSSSSSTLCLYRKSLASSVPPPEIATVAETALKHHVGALPELRCGSKSPDFFFEMSRVRIWSPFHKIKLAIL
ncbi:hypothetical protein COLO4_06517 [Corchorus olitorius]|uniref:Uncharacterized protein n=1 Tax=Corchorus olitorius TaxID=93759 RepID=A0A1R3KMU9_9ROSI|nr:hypothetical protein COLO4_06517 [Corchorus olitorius]